MAGIDIRCGSFRGEDKSGSAIEGVLAALRDAGTDADASAAVQQLLDTAKQDFVEIPAAMAIALLPSLAHYRQALVAAIGHDDWSREAIAEDQAGLDGIAAKWGAGRGWSLYCCDNLIKACEVARAETAPIYLIIS